MARKGSHSRHGPSGSATAVKVVLVVCTLLVLFAAGSTFFKDRAGNRPDVTEPTTNSVTTPSPDPEPDVTDVDATAGKNTAEPSAEPSASAATPSTTPGGSSTPASGKASDIGRSIAVPESAAVDDSYFDDAIFIGNSRTEGLKNFSGLPVSKFWSKVGLTVSTCFSDAFVSVNGQYMTVAQGLEQANYGKVYIMLGMNELGWVYESKYAEDYGRLIDVIQSSHPDAEIYVQSIIPVSKWLDTHPDANKGYNTMANVIRLQRALVDMVKTKSGVNYVNVAESMEDTDGYLFSDSTQDGLHLNAEYCRIWMQYLRTHTV